MTRAYYYTTLRILPSLIPSFAHTYTSIKLYSYGYSSAALVSDFM